MSSLVQMSYSYLLVTGLALAIAAFSLATLARFAKWKRVLAVLGLAGLACFTTCMLVLSPPSFRLLNFYFWLFTAAVCGGAVGTVTVRNVFHAALMLILSLTGVAGYFILVNAEFLAMVQVIIYIGGIMVLFLFGIMVSQNIIGTELKQHTPQAPWAAVAATILFLFMSFIGLFMSFKPSERMGDYILASNTQSMGWSLMATFTLPFEVASVMLLMAMLGAIILVRKE